MNIKMMLVALFVVASLSLGLFASMPVVDSILPWVGAVAVISAFWPLVSLLVGAFGIACFSDKGDVSVEFDLSKPGHKIGWVVSKMTTKAFRLSKVLASKAGQLASSSMASKKARKPRVVVQQVFKAED